MTNAVYQDRNPSTLPPGLEVDVEDNNGAKRQVVIVRNPSVGTALTTNVSNASGAAAVNVQDGGNSLTVDLGAIAAGVIITTAAADDFNHDAFGRDRVSEQNNRFDVEFTYDRQPLLMEAITAGSAGIAHQTATRDVALTIGATSTASSADFVGHYYVPYTPGNSQLVELTGTLDGNDSGGSISFFVRNNGSTTVYTSTQFTGSISGIDWGNSHIFAMDFQSLKVGRIRAGLNRSGQFHELIAVSNDNVRQNGYWQYPNQPVHYKIYNTTSSCVTELGYFGNNNGFGFRYESALSATQKLIAICATVKSEGGRDLFDIPGYPFSASNRATTKTVATTIIPLLSIQLSTTFNALTNRMISIPTSVSFVSDNSFYYEVRLNPTLTGPSWVAVSTSYSGMNYDVTASAVTGGVVIDSGYGGAGGTRAAGTTIGLTGRVPMSINYPGTVGDIVSICAVRVGAISAAMGASVDWKEIR